MTNTNTLKDFRCPSCKSDGGFNIEATTLARVSDDGVEDHGDMTWKDDSYCCCVECEYEGTVKEFKIANQPEKIVTMCHGHIVDAEIVERHQDGKIMARFLCHHASGSTRLCLDFGQNWNISKGETFKITQVQIDRAAELLAKDEA